MGIGGDKRSIVFHVLGAPEIALNTAQNALAAEKFKITPVDAWTCKASRSSKGKSLFLGAIAPFVEVTLTARSSGAEPGVTIVQMDQIPPGCVYAGGVVGVKRSRSHVDAARDHLQAAFASAGVLRSISEN